jgi:nucleotide-binding universal stress UspA family protein
MNQTSSLEGVKVESIFHPSDFSDASEVAFVHALKVALVTRANLSMLHVADDSAVEWHDFPGVRDTLERWKLIPKGSPRSAVGELGIGVRKILASSKDPVKACLGYLAKHSTDLIVLAVRQHDGQMRWLEKSIGEPIARGAHQMTLFIPHGVTGFVSRESGSVSLKNILVPIAAKPRPQPAVEAVARLIRGLELPAGTITLLHVGSSSEMPSVKLPDDTGWSWNRMVKSGEPVEVILEVGAKLPADLIVTTTEGSHGFLDALRGSTSERVLRHAHCPLASLPVGSMLG